MPRDRNVVAKWVDKIPNFHPLAKEIIKMHQMVAMICSIVGWLLEYGVRSIVGIPERTWHSGFGEGYAGICSAWNHHYPPKDSWPLSPRSRAETNLDTPAV